MADELRVGLQQLLRKAQLEHDTDFLRESIRQFVQWAQGLRGDEKSEAQLFCQELFRAFGHDEIGEAGAELEHRVKGNSGFQCS